MATNVNLPAAERDLRLDFFRGIALISIFIDHIPDLWLGAYTIQFTGFYDAADVFILISGYTAGLVYGRILATQGSLAATMRIYHRVWQLYVAHVFLFMIFMALVGQMAGQLNNPFYAEELRATDFLRDPGEAVLRALALLFHPAYMDILPLYITQLAVLPLFMLLLRRAWVLALGLSFVLWLAVQFNSDINLPSYPGPGHKWFFNPFAWQFLFLFSAFLGWFQIHGRMNWLNMRWLLAGAALIAGFGFAIRVNWTLQLVSDPVPFIKAHLFWPTLSKTDLSAMRLLNVLSMALLVATFVPRSARFLRHRAAWPFMVCGRHSLHIFCLGVLLSVTGHLILTEFLGEFWMQTAVAAGGVALMVGVAALMDWYRTSTKPARAPLPAVPEKGGGGMTGHGATVRRFGMAAAVAAGMVLAADEGGAQPVCAVPVATFAAEPLLPNTRAALAAGGNVRIVAVGGASTLGRAAGEIDKAWPAALARALRRKFPAARIEVANLGVPRDTAEAMLKRIERDVIGQKPTLVIWEAGITDSVRGTDLSAFSDALQKGIERLRAAGTEVMLMDMQFSRRSEFILNLHRYLGIMHGIAEINDVPLFPRHEIMRSWSDQGVFDYHVRGRDARRRLAIDVYDCIGTAVAAMIARGAAEN